MPLSVTAEIENFALRQAFRISRGAKSSAEVVVVTVTDGPHVGRGECVPYPRYGETTAATVDAIERWALTLADAQPDTPIADLRHDLETRLEGAAARNAVDCALFALEARRCGQPVHAVAGLAPPRPCLTCLTISIDTPQAMAAQARALARHPLLKLKLGGDAAGDAARMAAVRTARPEARIVVDANEGFAPETLGALFEAAVRHGIELIEQPLPARADAALATVDRPVPVCADESAHHRTGFAALSDRYDAVNIKLDKTGGLTAAITAFETAQGLGLKTMLGSMVASSLAMAPAFLLAGLADWVDLDSPALVATDRAPAFVIDGAGVLCPPGPDVGGLAALWA